MRLEVVVCRPDVVCVGAVGFRKWYWFSMRSTLHQCPDEELDSLPY